MATYTFDVFSTLDGFGSTHTYGGYWGKQGPELLERRERLFDDEQLMVFGPATYRMFERFHNEGVEMDPWSARVTAMPKVVVSRSMSPDEPMTWPNARLEQGDALDVVARLKEASQVPLRSHGSLSMNRALMAAGLVDRIQVTVFPIITGATGLAPIFAGGPDLDLELVESRILDGRTLELTYVPKVLTAAG
ncbi:MAG TPA: dihydrofolate reductase family protein [Candidatus Limnocylindria bacterium]|jgi:dihydrofolate reductase|nr:dihydrofolate reductase family protein [Candidatus Limnocylindria bacterium]